MLTYKRLTSKQWFESCTYSYNS